MKKGVVFLWVFLIAISSVSAIGYNSLLEFPSQKQNTNISLTQDCVNSTYSNITGIVLGNGTLLNISSGMQKFSSASFYNYTLLSENVTSLGTYIVNGICDENGIAQNWQYPIQVTPSGKEITTSDSIIVFFALGLFLTLAIICFAGFYRSKGNIGIALPVRWTFFILGLIMLLTTTNLLAAIIQDTLINQNVIGFFDIFTGASTYLFWFAVGLLAVMWILTAFQTILFKNKQMKMEKYG